MNLERAQFLPVTVAKVTLTFTPNSTGAQRGLSCPSVSPSCRESSEAELRGDRGGPLQASARRERKGGRPLPPSSPPLTFSSIPCPPPHDPAPPHAHTTRTPDQLLRHKVKPSDRCQGSSLLWMQHNRPLPGAPVFFLPWGIVPDPQRLTPSAVGAHPLAEH